MNKRIGFWIAVAVGFWASAAHAATLTVTTDKDEANCRSETGCSTPPNGMGEAYPNSTGCSLREALQDIADAAAPSAISYPECGTPDVAPGSNTIVLGAHTIQIYSAVKDPGDITGAADTHNGQLPFVLSKATAGALSITGGALSCQYDPQANPVIGGNSMFTTADGASLSFTGTSFADCTSPSDGVAIVNSGNTNGDLNLSGVTFTNIHAINQGNGGCIAHGSGNLLITGGSFTGCIVDDGTTPGSGNGNGGAIYMANAGGTSRVAISGVTFQGNIAGANGGAIYLNGTDAIAIDTSAFQANIAAGNTFDSGNAELGGGAIYALNTANGGNDGSQQGINASAFLLFQDSFVGNLAPTGTGGAILLSGGKLTYGTLSFNLAGYSTGVVGSIPGGIVASNFSGNIASGSWDTVNNGTLDPRAGSGGALFANGDVSILASSFVGGNTSTNASGGAIAYYDAGASHAPLAITNVTFNGNSAGFTGGAIGNIPSKFTSNAGKVTLINDTIAGNSAGDSGGGIYNTNSTQSDFQVSNTILANNTGVNNSGDNCNGSAFTNVVGNLQFNPDTGCGAMTAGDPQLAAAAPFGGVNALVFVMQLGATSVAQGLGDNPTCAASPVDNLDAALNSRPQGKPNCDSGAFESAALTPVRLQSFDVE